MSTSTLFSPCLATCLVSTGLVRGWCLTIRRQSAGSSTESTAATPEGYRPARAARQLYSWPRSPWPARDDRLRVGRTVEAMSGAFGARRLVETFGPEAVGKMRPRLAERGTEHGTFTVGVHCVRSSRAAPSGVATRPGPGVAARTALLAVGSGVHDGGVDGGEVVAVSGCRPERVSARPRCAPTSSMWTST
jgi:hypothetical protein